MKKAIVSFVALAVGFGAVAAGAATFGLTYNF